MFDSPDILLVILSHLSFDSLRTCRLVSRSWYDQASSKFLVEYSQNQYNEMRFRGTWTGDNTMYQHKLFLTSKDPFSDETKEILQISGHLQWRLARADKSSHLHGTEGRVGTEYVKGLYYRKDRLAHFAGYALSTSGSQRLLGLDEYKLTILDKEMGLHGFTRGWRNHWTHEFHAVKDWIWDRDAEWSWVDPGLNDPKEIRMKGDLVCGRHYSSRHQFGIEVPK
eukprot:TRINITY_DN3581_c0_g1_i3.p1 TRINITY_DN3581_c0_g1~~TRINITY_DN3581_c0_g1_i3.p1  ORF type:complete len:224 (-),score=14.99 TRINITY_DN3581_c0_g1_i3:292-963(-)